MGGQSMRLQPILLIVGGGRFECECGALATIVTGKMDPLNSSILRDATSWCQQCYAWECEQTEEEATAAAILDRLEQTKHDQAGCRLRRVLFQAWGRRRGLALGSLMVLGLVSLGWQLGSSAWRRRIRSNACKT